MMSNELQKVNCEIASHSFAIPNDVLELLWFENGVFKNFASNQVARSSYLIGKEDREPGYIEPSAININLPITPCPLELAKNDIGYFPTYKHMLPQSRYLYLKWLSDFSIPVDIGYVFLFYYGLERQLFFGKTEKALNMMLRLWTLYKENKSFEEYLFNAILQYCLTKGELKLFERVVSLIDENNIQYGRIISNYKVMVNQRMDITDIKRYYTNLPISARNTMKEVGTIWEIWLKNYLNKVYGSPFVPIPSELIQASPTICIKAYANGSLPRYIRDNIKQVYGSNRNSKIMRIVSDHIKKACELKLE